MLSDWLKRIFWRERTSKFAAIILFSSFFSTSGFIPGSIEEASADLYAFTNHTFTNCGKTGFEGPTEAACETSYSSASWETDNSLFYVTAGIQFWKVPITGTYRIVATGGGSEDINYASWGTKSPGLPAQMAGSFQLTEGDVIKILVGQKGTKNGERAGGGGGTFVTTFSNSPLIVAGGGGGPGLYVNGGDASTNPNPANSLGAATSANSSGGCGESGAGGAGLTSNGSGSPQSQAFINGGVGGDKHSSSCVTPGRGGFGGGGAGGNGGGGAGGYFGGAGGRNESLYTGGGGGGSYNSGTNQANTLASSRTSQGSVSITLECEQSELGTLEKCPGESALQIKAVTGTNTDGLYWVSIGGVSTQVYAIMNSAFDGGGWILAMKGKSSATAFSYDSNYWSTNNTLNTSSPSRIGTSNTDAKYSAFNSFTGNEVLALFPGVTSKAGGAFSSLNSTYGFSWKENFTTTSAWSNGSTAGNCPTGRTTLLDLFDNSERCRVRQVSASYSASESPYSAIGDGVFSSQTHIRFFGFNYEQNQVGGTPNAEHKARWGFGWNENGTTDETSNDVVGGIGLAGTGSTRAAGDYIGCCVVQAGLNSDLAYELYVRDYPIAPGPPAITSITNSSGQLSVAFSAPTNNGGASITDYKYSLNGGAYTSAGTTSSPIVITGLTNGTTYSVTLKAVNSRGDGYASTSSSGTPGGTPSAPTSLSATAENGQATISFTPGADGGSSITNYKYSIDGSTYTALSPADASSPITITGLTNGTPYSITLKAVNAAGDSAASTSVSVTPRTTPSPPTSLSASAGNGQATISFTAGADGGSAITNYKYSIDGSTYTALSPADGTSPITITGLTNGTPYSITLKAVNAAGDSAASSSVSVTPVTVPGAPTGVTATVTGTTTANVTFSAPASNGGSTITSYTVTSSPGGITGTRNAATGGTVSMTGLSPNTAYTFTVIATNAVGNSSSSSASSSVTTLANAVSPTISGQPGALTRTLGQSATFSVTASASDSGVLTYQWRLNGSNISGATSSSYSIATITSDSAGTYSVVVTNTKNSTTATATSNNAVLTIVGAPEAPRNVTFSTNNASGSALSAGSLRLFWTAPASDGGSAVTGYEYRYSLASEDSWSSWTLTSDTGTVLTGLGNSRTYKAQVRARNAYGVSASASTSANVTTTGSVATAPTAPTINTIDVDRTAGGKLTINFTAPTVIGDQNAITSYQYSTDNGSSWKTATWMLGTSSFDMTTPSNSTSALVNGTSYTVLLRAVNAAGPGTASAGVAAIPSKAPGAPTSLSLALPGGNASGTISATFTAPTDTGGLTLSYEYRIKLSSSNTWGSWTAGGSSSPISITGITNGQTYDVQVRAKNSSGESTESNTATLNTVLATGPTITTQPTNKILTVDQTTGTTLTVAATGAAGETLSYQWYKNGSAISGATSATYTITSKAVTGDAGTYYAVVTASKSGASSNVSAKIDAMGPSNSICNAPNNQTFYYANRFYAGTADTIREFQIQMTAGTNISVLSSSKIRFYSSTNSTGSGTFYNTWTGAFPQPNEPARVIGTDFSYVSITDNIATFRGTAALPAAGHYWWAFINNSTTSVNFCNSNSTETYTNGWYLYKEGSSWIWFGSFRQNIDNGKFAWYTHPNIRIFTSTTTTTSTSTTQSNSVTVTVNPVPTITTSTVPGATRGSAYSTTLASSGGTGPYTWTLANGSSLPQGLSLSSSGVISGTPTATQASTSSSSSSASSLKNGDFSAPFANTATDGWFRAATRGGQTVINTVGKTLQFSFGMPACTSQTTVPMSEVRQQVTVATAGTVTFKVKVINDIWNRIGAAYSNPCYDPYQVTMTRSGNAATGKPTIVDTGRRIPNATTHPFAQEHEVTLTFETTQANEVVTISLFGLDAGYWAGNYGPVFKDARLETPGGSSGANSSSGTTTFTVEITDANGVKSTKTLTFAVASNISITTKTVGNANRGSSYTQALAATGGSGSLTWAVTSGSLPTGLTLSSSGTISGTVGTSANSSTFTVSATDANNASVTQTYTLNVLSGVPAAPTSLTLGTVGSGTIPLTWTAPTDNGGSPITGYVVSYSSGKGAGDDGEEGEEDKGSVLVSATGLTFPYSLTGLKNGRTYSVSVAAKNANANSVASNTVTAVPAKAAGAPQQLSMVLANGGITFRWRKPQDSGGLKIGSYTVQCRNNATTDTELNWKTITNRRDTDSNGQISLVLDSTSTELTVAKGQSYLCRVRANSSIGGVNYTGAWATTASPISFSTIPSAPSITTVDTTTASTKVTVTFTQSTDDGGSNITSYIATVKKSTGNANDDDNDENKRSCNVNRPTNGWVAGNQNCQITGVPKKGTFSVEVVAVNAVGKSVSDTETVTIRGSTQVLTYPDNTNNPGYTFSKTVNDADFPISVTSNSGLKLKYTIDNNDVCTITGKGLIKIKKVGSCRITITQSGKADDDDDDDENNKTDSDWEPITGNSQFVNVNISGSTPSNPSWTSVTPGNTLLTATWKAPTGRNNQVTGYRLEWTTDANGVTWQTSDSMTVAANVLTTNITGLTNGTGYRVRVTAVNSGAFSSAVLMPGVFTPAGVPTKPVIDSILSFPDTSTVTISWSAPANNGSAITGYTVTAYANGQTSLTCSGGGSATSCSITGVKNKVTYSVSMTARNAIGTSLTSDSSTVTVAGVSQTITLNTTPAGTGWSVGDPNLQIDASTNSGLPLQYSVQSSSICTVSTGGSVYFVSDGTCRVYINQDGTNSASGNGSATKYSPATQYGPIELVISPAKPSAPTLTSVTNNPSGLVIAWTAPSKGGGTMTYTITGTASGKTNETCSTSSLTCTIAVASKGTRYSFTAVAYNGIDTSTVSTAMFGTWLVAPSAPTSSTTPSAPSNTDGKALNIYWNKSNDNGGLPIMSYTATATNATYGNRTCVVTRTSTRDETGYSCAITGLRAGASYAVTVTALNAIGTSSALSIGSLTPGLTQTISLVAPTATSMSKVFGDPSFTLNASIDSGNTPTFSTSSTTCSVSSTGVVNILGVGSCVVTIAHPGATDSVDSQYKAASSVTVTITITPGTPSKATITQVSPTNGGLIVRWTAPSFTGGATLSYTVRAVNGGTTVTCNGGGSDTCTVTSLINETEYDVTVVANNGTASSTSDVVKATPYSNARAPMPLSANGGTRQAVVTWQQPVEYAGNLHKYQVHYRVAGSSGDYTILEVETSTVTANILSLANNTRYEFKVRAIVIDAQSVTSPGEFTRLVYATTFAAAGAPQSPIVSSTYVSASSTSTAAISWQPPASNGGAAITGYTVTVSGSSATCTTTTALTCNLTGLTPGVAYTISIVANTAVGAGATATTTHTTVAPASAPSSVALTLGSDSGTVTVNWGAPTSDGGTPITSYVVTVYTEAGAATSYGCTVSAPSTSCVITGLPYKTSYKIAVAAVTSAGTGTYSAFSSPFTLSKDQTITFAEISNQAFNIGTLTLDATSDSGLAVSYTSSNATVCSVSGSTVTFQKIGNCAITAAQAGDSTYNAATSVTRSFAIQAIDPGTVTLLQVAPGASKLTVTWSQATQLGGSTLKHYVVSWAKQTDFSDEQTLTTTTYQNVEITGLDAGSSYIVRIRVVTNDGTNPSEWSNRLSAKTLGAPTAPAAPTATSTAAGVVRVTWTDISSSNNGGTPITGYRVDAFVASSGASTSFFCTAATSPCDVSGLSGSIEYKFKVTAINAVGSATSEFSNALRPGSSQTISFGNVSTSNLAGTIKLAATSTSGLPITYSIVSQSPTNAESATWGSGRNVCVVDSQGNLTVDVGGSCVIAANQDGTDNGTETAYLPATEVRATITVSIDKPSAIDELTLTAGNQKITVAWAAPDSDGGAPITDYIVTWFVKGTRESIGESNLPTNGTTAITSGGSSYGRFVVSSSTLTQEITGLVNGTTYSIRVQAKNSAGVGPES